MKSFLTGLLFSIGILLGQSEDSEANKKISEWTIMIYMNADNNLEPDALINFGQMAEIGGTENVNVLVQFDRTPEYVSTNPDWYQTLRFRISKGIRPYPLFALEDLGEVNMGNGNSLAEFVDWTKYFFPANRYFLVIWDHGQGWRILRNPNSSNMSKGKKKEAGNVSGASFRSISEDESHDSDVLFNKEIQQALKLTLGNHKLDLIGFDACLMSMVETAYAMREVAHFMVASEEEEPAAGWNYKNLMQRIVKAPPKDGKTLAKEVVSSYEEEYKDRQDSATTLSAIDLSKIEILTESIDAFSKIATSKLDSEIASIRKSRNAVKVYAPGKGIHHVDLGLFLDELSNETTDPELKKAAISTRKLLASSVIANYAAKNRIKEWGSTGLAIYFPSSKLEYIYDEIADQGYDKKNQNYPVDFVIDHLWADFLYSYWDFVQK